MGLLLAAHWQHNLDPFLVRFPEGFFLPGIRWYGVAYLAGFVAAWFLLRVLARRRRLGDVQPGELGDLVFWSAIGAVLGGRLGYSLLYNFSITLREPWSILRVWEGGMASHGGIVGVAIALIVWTTVRQARGAAIPQTPASNSSADTASATRAQKKKEKRRERRRERSHASNASGSFLRRCLLTVRAPLVWSIADGVVSSATVGLFFGRVANFINGELWGRPSDVPWAVIFPESPPPLVARHPSALYEAALEGLFLFLWLYPGVLRGRWKPGGAVARFIVGYAVVRFVVEFFREPDEGIGLQWLNLTRGQWLSVVMAAIGVALLVWLRGAFRPAQEPQTPA